MCIRDRKYSSQLENQLQEMNRLITGWLKIASGKLKMWYNIHSNSAGFEEGNQIWFYNPKHHHGRFPKFQSNWEGPYTVKKRTINVVYQIQQGQRTFKIVHLDRLVKHYCRNG